jgi:hypothetical protein
LKRRAELQGKPFKQKIENIVKEIVDHINFSEKGGRFGAMSNDSTRQAAHGRRRFLSAICRIPFPSAFRRQRPDLWGSYLPMSTRSAFARRCRNWATASR